jgi:hypothetical protein
MFLLGLHGLCCLVQVCLELDMVRRVNGWYQRLCRLFQTPTEPGTRRPALASSARVDAVARLIIDYGCVPLTEEEAMQLLAHAGEAVYM